MILKKQYFVNNEVENDCFNVNNNICIYNMFSYNTTVIIILRGVKMIFLVIIVILIFAILKDI